MFGLGVTELVVILVVVLLIFGPRKLPELGSFVGKSLKDFREALENRDHDDGDPPATNHEPSDKARDERSGPGPEA